MGFTISSSLSIILLSLAIAIAIAIATKEAQQIKSSRLLDLVIRDYTFRSHTKHSKTGKLYKINLPSNLSGIDVDAVRFRCGSLRRYGARIKEFHVSMGVHVHPCGTRVMLLRQSLGPTWSSLYYDNFDLSGYRLISPVLGLLAYSTVNSSEVAFRTTTKPIVIDFSSSASENASQGIIPLCASFDRDGRVTLSNRAGPNACVATGGGHFGLVVESPLMPMRRKVGGWKTAALGAVAAALAGFLLSLLAIAVFVKAKKKKRKRMEEMERMTYEEEALRVSMVGHVRAVTASATRTLPTIEHYEYRTGREKEP